MAAHAKSTSLSVEGMPCASCVSHNKEALKEIPSVTNVVVNLGTGKASASYDPAPAGIDALRRAVENVGYSVPLSDVTLGVSGMTCASCVAHIEGALKELEGVTEATVNLGLNTAHVSYIAGIATISAMKRAVKKVGYDAEERSSGADVLDRERQARSEEVRRQGLNLLISGRLACW